MQTDTDNLRQPWRRFLQLGWPLGLFLVLVFGAARFVLATGTTSYRWLSVYFLGMILLPLVLLTRRGQWDIGWRKPENSAWLGWSALIGLLYGALAFALGQGLFGDTNENWAWFISRAYAPGGPGGREWLVVLSFAIPALLFSPLAEEMLYRGLIHRCFWPLLGENGASRADSLAFALTYLAHFGLLQTAEGLRIQWFAAFLWVVLLFGLGRLLFLCKTKTNSLAGAIACHAGFNLGMGVLIFYWMQTST